MALVAALLCPWLLAACGSEAVRMLHERPSFEGEITVETDALSVTGELVFERQSGHCQLTRRKPATVALGRDRDGQLFAFEGDSYRPIRPKETRQLDLVLAVVDGNGITSPRVRDQGYSLQLPVHGRVRVIIRESKIQRHGQHR